jgi:hypothetical protein
MATHELNLIPEDLGDKNRFSPANILREQARIIEERFNGRLKGEVIARILGENIVLVFYLTSPTLDNYRYRVFTVIHKNIIENAYPVTISDWGEQPRQNLTQDQFIEELRSIFASDAFKRLVTAMDDRGKNIPA